jgi:hypothetical protein
MCKSVCNHFLRKKTSPKRYYRFIRMAIWVGLLFLPVLVGCEQQTGSSPPSDERSVEEADSLSGAGAFGYQRQQVLSVQKDADDPIGEAMALVGAVPTRGDLPHFVEAGYNLTCTLPIVDDIQRAPLQMPVWARLNAGHLQSSAQHGLAPLLARLMETLDPENAIEQRNVPDEELQLPLLAKVLEKNFRQMGGILPQSHIEKIAAANFSTPFENLLAALVQALLSASQDVEDALRALDTNEKQLLRTSPERYFFPNLEYFKFLTGDTHRQLQMVQIAQKVDFPKLFRGAFQLSRAVDQFISATERLKHGDSFSKLFIDGNVPDGEILHIPTPAGELVLLGKNDNRFVGEAALLIDLDGDDRYISTAAENGQAPLNVCVSIDFGGNDFYDARRHKSGQGAGSLSIGLMVDRDGNDEYQAGDIAQGAALFGVGLLCDQAGNDIYHMGLMGQGFGLFGFGALADLDGNDRYVQKGMGQGAGSTLGVGALLDAQGNDKYLAGGGKARSDLIPDLMTHSQGAGFSIRSHIWAEELSVYGGIGVLSDSGGNDLYHATGGNCMGSSYFMSLGALVDHEGNDIYMAEGGYGVGFGLHLSNGVLLDIQGDDTYIAGAFCGGFGSDRSVGILVDEAGNDIYGPSERYIIDLLTKSGKEGNRPKSTGEDIIQKMADTSYGAALKPKATGLLVDIKGDDQYFANTSGKGESIGGVIPPVSHEDWSHGLAVDLGGSDRYNLPGKKNNKAIVYYEHGILYDTNYKEPASVDTLFPAFDTKNAPKFIASRPTGTADRAMEIIHHMADADLWGRFLAKGELLQIGPTALEACSGMLRKSTYAVLNNDLFEIFNHNLVNGGRGFQTEKLLTDLISTKSRQVKLRAIYLSGWHRLKTARDSLEAICLQSDDPIIGASAFWALGRLAQVDALQTLIKGVDKTNALETRRAAYGGIAFLIQERHHDLQPYTDQLLKILLAGLASGDPVVKVLSIGGLENYYGRSMVAKAIEQQLADPNVYVRRQASRVSAFKGKRNAIPVLIESLKFPSIDTFEHYDHEIAKDLSYLCGVDFPDEKRYQYETWHRWWAQNGSVVKLDRNLRIMGLIKKAFRQPDLETGLDIFEELMASYPDNEVIRKRYKRFCREWITFRLLNQAHAASNELEKAIKVQKILVSLEPKNRVFRVQLQYLKKELDTVTQNNRSR